MTNPIADLDRFRSDLFEPVSFRERGTTVPFTTPLLLNARIRAAAFGRGFEMVVSNPSGGRGALIMPWSAMPDISAPTLFDRYLWESLATSADISPISIRHEAQRLVAMGLAGRPAALAARDAQQREQASQRLMRAMLLDSIINATETPNESAGRTDAGESIAYAKRAERAVTRAAAMAGLPLADLIADVEKLALILSGAAPEIEGEDARLRQMLKDLRRMAEEINDWAVDQEPESAHVLAANFVVASARQTLECGEFALANTDALIADFGLLMPKWKTEKDSVIERAQAPDWVLDGWKTPIALWQAAGPNQRRAAIWEIALIAPVMPREAKAWLSAASDWRGTPRRITQVVRDKADWRSGGSMEIVARNENLIGFSISYENRVTPMVMRDSKVNVARFDEERETKTREIIPRYTQDAIRNTSRNDKAEPAKAKGRVNNLRLNRALGEMIEGSSDRALSKIVSLVDRLGNPDIHARLLGPSLRRLKRLRPPRPASLMRMLFMPLAGALMDPLQWRRSEGHIPRSALPPLLESLKQALGTQLEVLSVHLRSGSLEDGKLVRKVGHQLWQLAGSAAPHLLHSDSWARAGISQTDFDAITNLAGALWRHAAPLWDGMQQVAGDCTPEALRAALIGPAHENNMVFAAALHALLQRAVRPSIFVSLMQDFPAQVLPVVEEVLSKWMGVSVADLVDEDFATGARLAQEMGIVIAALEGLPRITAKTDAKELVAHRRNLEHFCRRSYQELVSTHVIQALLVLAPEDTEGLMEIEGAARIARSLEDTGRRVGPPHPYQELQQEFRLKVPKQRQEDAKTGVTAMEIARIEEILIGHEAVERLLSSVRPQRQKNR